MLNWSQSKYNVLNMKSLPLFQQRKRASTWARRKTHISTPVAITTDAEQQEGNRNGHFSLGWSKTWICWMGAVELGSKKKKWSRNVYTLLVVFFFCAIKNWRLQDFTEEDLLLLILGGEGFNNFHPVYVPCFILISWSLFLCCFLCCTMGVNVFPNPQQC